MERTGLQKRVVKDITEERCNGRGITEERCDRRDITEEGCNRIKM